MRVDKKRAEQRAFVSCSSLQATCLALLYLHHFHSEKERTEQSHLPAGFSPKRVSQVISGVHCDWSVFFHCSLFSAICLLHS